MMFVTPLYIWAQQVIDISPYTPSLKKCNVCFDNNYVYFDMFTNKEEISFAMCDPVRSYMWQIVANLNSQELDFYSKQEFVDNYVTSLLDNLPANTQIRAYQQNENNLIQERDKNLPITARPSPAPEETTHQPLQSVEPSPIGEERQNTSKRSLDVGSSLERILLVLLALWLGKKLLGAIFGRSGSKRSGSDKYYEDASWFHDNKKDM